jgi:hypothetical protein
MLDCTYSTVATRAPENIKGISLVVWFKIICPFALLETYGTKYGSLDWKYVCHKEKYV